jgi:hypothetical protein
MKMAKMAKIMAAAQAKRSEEEIMKRRSEAWRRRKCVAMAAAKYRGESGGGQRNLAYHMAK